MMTWQAWERRARQLSAQTYALYLAYRHPRTPWYAKVFAALIDTGDPLEGDPNFGVCNVNFCTLRTAIIVANNHPG
jgi:hypothetical protein